MAFTFEIKQNIFHRTRIRIPELKGVPLLCKKVEQYLLPLHGVTHVEVRPKSGSIILIHPKRGIPIDQLLSDLKNDFSTYMETSGKGKKQKGKTSHSNLDPSPPMAGEKDRDGYHVSGKTLILSGLYILYLMARRIFLPIPLAPSVIDRIVSLPFIAAFWLAFPIQRQAMDNLKATGKVDMGMISTILVYLALFTGNIVSALVVTWLFNFSGWMETRIKERTRQTIREMLTGKVAHTWKVMNGTEIEVPLEGLQPGDIIALNQGDLLPVDGMVVKGDALIDEAAMTGEGLPLAKYPGDAVLAGTVIIEGGIHVRVEKTGEKTRLAAIIRLIESAETDTGELGRLSLGISQAMVPVSLILAAATFLVTGNFLQAMTVIMITCPCSLRLSTAVAVSVAMGNAASRGILIKGGSHVEMAGRVDVLVVDKTGTLTRSRSTVTAIEPVDKRYKKETILKLTASLLHTSRHPLGHAVVQAAHEQNIQLLPCDNRQLIMGKGARGTVGKQTLLVGSHRLMEAYGILDTDPSSEIETMDMAKKPDPHSEALDTLDRGKINNFFPEYSNQEKKQEHYRDASVIFVAADSRLIGRIEVGNMIREDASKETMARIRAAGVKYTAMLSGDTRSGCADLKELLGFDEVQWGMSPERKADWIAHRKKTHPGERIAVVGDGINDTPAFALSDLSFAVGEGGVDVTMEVADIVLQQGGIGHVATSLAVGRETLDTIRESYTIAIGCNAATLFMMTLGIISPIAGALLHNLTTVYAVSNAAKSTGNAHQIIQT